MPIDSLPTQHPIPSHSLNIRISTQNVTATWATNRTQQALAPQQQRALQHSRPRPHQAQQQRSLLCSPTPRSLTNGLLLKASHSSSNSSSSMVLAPCLAVCHPISSHTRCLPTTMRSSSSSLQW